MFLTLDTSQFDKSQLKYSHLWNIWFISLTFDTSQSDILIDFCIDLSNFLRFTPK